ncbi:hypothetical protein COR50_19725 [Chitinophaga caeni]|uniref:PhnB-like domain-containing protein n=1 Tax=Chitinophaga caeni TaxID=2029983 RepID=A0A291QZF3_9BACT|nr:VOC family protein [Chitinophaga caeni]ATL49224.1 hypothetical protein COR50_19725 [Chitinophaga caeni]
MSTQVTTFLMFEGKAKEAMEFYVSLFENSKITNVDYYEEGEMGPAGTVKVATFSLNGRPFMAIDSHVKHQFTFTPAISLFVNCTQEEEIEKLYKALSEGGGVLMPLGAYGFSKKFTWVNDRFGVSWQISYD